MATTTLDSGADSTIAVGKRWRRTPTTLDGAPSAAVTTYYYRTSGGARGSTTDAGSIPAGAVVERVT